jgi:hypothetical protein
MRLIVGFFMVATAGLFLAQSSDDFHRRYGEPDLERFQVRPSIELTVEYGSDHLACKVTIEPSPNKVGQTRLINSDVVSEILEQVAPVDTRGAVLTRSSFQNSCGTGYQTEYENVSIARGFSACEMSKPDHDSSTQIWFKRDACPRANKPLTISSPNSR